MWRQTALLRGSSCHHWPVPTPAEPEPWQHPPMGGELHHHIPKVWAFLGQRKAERAHAAARCLGARSRTLVITIRPLTFSVTFHAIMTLLPREIALHAMRNSATIATIATLDHASPCS